MKIKDLIELLKQLDKEAKIEFVNAKTGQTINSGLDFDVEEVKSCGRNVVVISL